MRRSAPISVGPNGSAFVKALDDRLGGGPKECAGFTSARFAAKRLF
jgi:hypothetical protein